MSLAHFDLTGIPAMARLRDMVQGRKVILIGSAPGAHVKAEDVERNLIVCVNAAALGLAGSIVPDITFVNTAIAGPHPVAVKTRERLQELQTKSLFIIESAISINKANRILGPIERKSTDYITLAERCDILEAFLKRPLSGPVGEEHVPSTGFFVCILLIACGALHVKMTGFSFSDGHSYLSSVARREHILRDLEVLKLIVDREMPVAFPEELIDVFNSVRNERCKFKRACDFYSMARQLLNRITLFINRVKTRRRRAIKAGFHST